MTRIEPSAFGDALRRLRLEAGLTQEDLAERAGLSVRGLSDLERGLRRTPRPGTARLLADALGLHGGERERLLASRDSRGVSPTFQPSAAVGPAVMIRRNLPAEVSTLVDRERETAELSALVCSHRLVTLTGPGGVGKTRLAMQVASVTASYFADGACVIELAALTDPELVADAIAASLNIPQRAGRPTAELLTGVLQDQHRLLLLDNCEQVIGGVAALLASLTRSCPRLHVLATSRERLAIAGEVAWTVEPLPVPPPAPAEEVGRLAEAYPAVRLFVDRARAAQQGFELDEGNAGAVIEVCRRRDGLPLAIELAAARTRLLSVKQIADRLDDRFRLLTSGPRTAPSRHRALWDAIAWSYDLLTQREQRLLRLLAVFAGGFTLEAAEAVGEPDPLVVDTLGRLVDTSLVTVEHTRGTTRYGLCESVLAFARDRLEDAGEAAEALARMREFESRRGIATCLEVLAPPPTWFRSDGMPRAAAPARSARWSAASG